IFFFFVCLVAPRALHSFPTRRSSDLGSIALTIAAHNSLCIGHLLIAANDEQKRRWLPPLARGEYLGAWALTEPSSGSDAIAVQRSEEHTSELQSRSDLVCRLLLEKKK